MPELPELETVMRGLEPVMTGHKITDVWLGEKGLRSPFPDGLTERLTGKKIVRLSRRAKYILVDLADDNVLVLHLGMSGRVRIERPGSNAPAEKHDHFKLALDGGTQVTLNDARRFGMVFDLPANDLPIHRAFKDLGPEPLDSEFGPDYLSAKLKNKTQPIKLAIMDQRVVVGVGNIYASEALHRAGISPKRQAGRISRARLIQLVEEIRNVLNDAIADGGSSLRDHRTAYGEFGYFQQRLSVYARAGQPCKACKEQTGETYLIEKAVQGGRATYYCPHCQK